MTPTPTANQSALRTGKAIRASLVRFRDDICDKNSILRSWVWIHKILENTASPRITDGLPPRLSHSQEEFAVLDFIVSVVWLCKRAVSGCSCSWVLMRRYQKSPLRLMMHYVIMTTITTKNCCWTKRSNAAHLWQYCICPLRRPPLPCDPNDSSQGDSLNAHEEDVVEVGFEVQRDDHNHCQNTHHNVRPSVYPMWQK